MTDGMKTIAHIHNDFKTKFGIPRQSGIIDSLKSTITFVPEFRNSDILRGLEGFSHIWLIWKFSESIRDRWSPMVRPPRLGGSKKMGVLATRSPFRPNNIGLSSVRIASIELSGKSGPLICVTGADLLDNTPIYDIKPYLSYTDSHIDAKCGFADTTEYLKLDVHFPPELRRKIPEDTAASIIKILENDPRPHYQNDSTREYGFEFHNYNIKFIVHDNRAIVINLS